MESSVTKEFLATIADTTNFESTDTFQSFIYELFEKNGILNDLRAYLRRHIVNVLKNAQTGDPPACQRNFTQRLELNSQALNILIAEYLMHLEFSYSFSVFISEIPLSNMVFEFARTLLMKSEDCDITNLRFRDNDIWSILNYLGVQCDSEQASNIVKMYRKDDNNPLLLCILKCMFAHKHVVGMEQEPSEESLSSARSIGSIDKSETKTTYLPDKCKHYDFCKTCRNRVSKVKEKYKKKKNCLLKNAKDDNDDPFAMETILKNISVLEKSIIEEMFQQLKSVYETEVEMVKAEEEKKVKRSMATHAVQLQKKRNEMEQQYQARSLELERDVQQKKQFLWGLARALRLQHEQLARAMRAVAQETERLTGKEESLKTQLAEAEDILKKRGEDLRIQISNELSILEEHLESMKKERDNISRERSELEHLKNLQNNSIKVIKKHNMESEDVHSHYELLKNELIILKKYLETSRMTPKCVIERGTLTDTVDSGNFNILNNKAEKSKTDCIDDRSKTNQLVNDFKKKNVNFSQSNLDEIYRENTRSSGSSVAGDVAAGNCDIEREKTKELIQRLTEENERLKAYAVEQSNQNQEISSRHVSTQRPCTAPAVTTQHNIYAINTSASANTVNVGWRKGAGEELSVFSNAQPRILVPGDTLPFIGVLRDRHGIARSNRQQLMQQQLQHTPSLEINTNPEKNTKSTYRQSRRDSAKVTPSQRERDGSPNAVLREAKLRLRKLEIEAEAVEKSYLDFRRRQSALRLERNERKSLDEGIKDKNSRPLEIKRSRSLEKPVKPVENEASTQIASLEKSMKKQFGNRENMIQYLHRCKNKFDIGHMPFKSKPTILEKVKPIPSIYSQIGNNNETKTQSNYLETPLTEFRKLYTSARKIYRDKDEVKSTSLNSEQTSTANDNHKMAQSSSNDTVQNANKEAELEKQNISNNNLIQSETAQISEKTEEEHILSLEVESVNEIKDIKSETQDLLLVVQSSVNTGESITESEQHSEVMSTQMTIIVSPKRDIPSKTTDEEMFSKLDQSKRSESPEQAAHLTRNDVLDAIFANPNNQNSSVQMQLELSKESMSENDRGDEYPDDFSEDIENYTSRSDYEHSPISQAKTSEDDNFWES